MRLGVQVTPGQRIGQLRKDVLKHACAQVLRDFFFVNARFVQRIGMKSTAGIVPGLRQKRGPLKEQVKQAQRVPGLNVIQLMLHAWHAQSGGQIHFKKLFSPRTSVLPVKPPHRAVGEQTLLDGAVRHHVGAAQVAQHLGGRRVGI